MAKLRGEQTRLEVNIGTDDTPDWVNVAGEMSIGGGFSSATDTANTKDNKSGWSIVGPVRLSGTLELTCEYPIGVENSDDLAYKDFFGYGKDKAIRGGRLITPVFDLEFKFVVLNVSLSASNASFTEYTVSLGYAEKPKFTVKTS